MNARRRLCAVEAESNIATSHSRRGAKALVSCGFLNTSSGISRRWPSWPSRGVTPAWRTPIPSSPAQLRRPCATSWSSPWALRAGAASWFVL